MICWSGNWIAAKWVAPLLPSQTLVFYRFLVSALVFVVFLLWQKISFKIPPSQWIMVGITSLLMGLYQWAFFKGIHLGLAGTGGVLVTTLNPIITFGLVALIHQKSLRKRELLGLGLGVLSAGLMLRVWRFNWTEFLNSGTGFFVLAAFAWAVLSIASQKVRLNPIVHTFYMMALVIPLFALGTPTESMLAAVHLGPFFWGNMGFMALFGTLFATSVFFLGTQQLGPKTSTAFMLMIPTCTAFLAWLLLGETLAWPTAVGGLMALIGVSLLI